MSHIDRHLLDRLAIGEQNRFNLTMKRSKVIFL
jgi:hypothetical protein